MTAEDTPEIPDHTRRANSVAYAFSPKYLDTLRSAGLDPTAQQRLFLAALAWYADESGFAWPTESDMILRTSLGHTSIAEIRRWLRDNYLGGRAGPFSSWPQRRPHAPTYIAPTYGTPDEWAGPRGTVYAVAKGLPLDPQQRMILAAVLYHDGPSGVWASRETIAEFATLSRATTTRALAHLRELEIINTQRLAPGQHYPNGVAAPKGGAVHLVDWNRLRAIASTDHQLA